MIEAGFVLFMMGVILSVGAGFAIHEGLGMATLAGWLLWFGWRFMVAA